MKSGFIPCLTVALVIMSLVQGHEGDEARQKRLWPTRCYPGSHCYPDHEDIDGLRKSLTGSVIVPSDSLYVNSISMTNERMTRFPGIIVVARTVQDVQKAMLFAREFFMNVVTSGAGVDYQGRGSYDGSLKIDLSQLKSVTVSTNINNFNVAGTVTALAGNTWGEIYSEVERTGTGRLVVGGTQSLDSVDFFTLTGGLGVLSRSLGLAADNLVTGQVVLADGRLGSVSNGNAVITNEDGTTATYEFDPTEFIRGGGLTWGIPVSFTFNLHFPRSQYGSLSGSYKIVDDGNVAGKPAFTYVMQQLMQLPNQWGGYVVLDGSPSNAFPNDKGLFKFNLFSFGFYNFSRIGTPINNLANYFPLYRESLNSNPSLFSYSQWRQSQSEADQHFTSMPNAYVMNTLIDRDVFTDPVKLDQFADLMMDVANSPTVDSNYKCVGKLAGGVVASSSLANSVNPAFRSAAFSWSCALTWTEGPVKESFYVAEALEFQKKLRAFGNGGVDGHFASEDINDWKASIYGNDNYKKLLEGKRGWDVDNFLWAHNAVASDIELNCRGIRCPHKH